MSYITKRTGSQYSAANAWNANNNGQLNNNNKRNGNRVVAVSDFQMYNLFVENMFAAYYECRRNKRRTHSETQYEMDGIRNTLQLAEDVWNYRYVISPSICFIVTRPTRREVFAADFRDRILDTWVAQRIERIFEHHLHDCIFANRKGKGTSAAIRRVQEDIIACTDNYTKDAWIYKFDIQGFFMSIDKRILWDRLRPVLEEEYREWDKDYLMYVIEKRIFNRPQEGCIKVCAEEEWALLPANKSLFNQDEWHGLPIGDLLSQMLVGFFIIGFIDFLKSLGFEYISNYVDDFVIISPSKDKILESIPKIREFLKTMQLTLHPRKCYIQHYTKGVAFLGAIIKPHRIYPGERLRRNVLSLRLPRKLKDCLPSVNSYLGLLRHLTSRCLRQVIADRVFARFHKRVYFSRDFLKMAVKRSTRKEEKERRKSCGLEVYYLSRL